MSVAQEAILTLARTLSGAGEDEEPLLEALCRAAEQRWKERLLPGVTAEDCGEAFPCAAAFTAAADLTAAKGGDRVSGFTAGSVSVQVRSPGEASTQAAELRRTARRLMAPFTAPGDFAFQGGRG